MKLAIFLGVLAMSLIHSTAANEISIRVSGIDSTRPGNIIAMVFGPDGYPKKHDKALDIQTKKADANEIVFRFAITREPFAIKILHDENEDGKTSKNWTGLIPSEGLGFSKGAKLSWRGPPKFKDASLDFADIEKEIVIPIIYP